ncbi:MAG: adenylate/guanylate cyclase domain-containing protein [Bauldia sp.]
MTAERIERRLAAILAADVAGYSRLMGADEESTLASLTAHRRELIDPSIARHRGRIVKTTGDGLLAEFASVVDAVRCAAEVQAGMAERNAASAAGPRLDFRIGINVGDIVEQDDDIFGDGVNIAARLEAIADPGGIAISASVRDQVGDRLAVTFEDMGEQTLKNIARPVRVYSVRWGGEPAAAAGLAPALAVPGKPSLAVMPFANMSGDPEQEYFADGLVEDLITNLSKMPGFFVIARNSTFAYKGTSVDIRKVAKELGVRYVLEGSVRRAANRVRITGQLIEGSSGNHVWAEKFEGAFEDIFDLQDRLTESIVGALEPTLRRAEIERARSKRPETLDAYDFYLRALTHGFDNTLAENAEAIRLLNEALRLDPNYAVAHAHAAWCHEQRYFRGGFNPEDRIAAETHAAMAIDLGADDPQALSIGAFVAGQMTHDYDAAIRTLGRALETNPNSALAFGFSALLATLADQFALAIEHAEKALRLSPNDPLNYHPRFALAIASLFTGRLEDAVRYATLTTQAKPSFDAPYTFLIAALVNLDRLDEAQAAGARLLKFVPHFRISSFLRADYWRPPRMEMLAAGLRKAGLPD